MLFLFFLFLQIDYFLTSKSIRIVYSNCWKRASVNIKSIFDILNLYVIYFPLKRFAKSMNTNLWINRQNFYTICKYISCFNTFLTIVKIGLFFFFLFNGESLDVYIFDKFESKNDTFAPTRNPYCSKLM